MDLLNVQNADHNMKNCEDRMKEVCSECEDEQSQQSFKENTFQYLLTEKRTILLNSEINDNLIERLVIPIIQLNEMDDASEADSKSYDREDHPIKIYINSVGGNVFETMSAVSAIMSSKTPIYTYALGKALSGGFFLLAAGHKRHCQLFSTICYHQMQCRPASGALQSGKEDVEESLRLQAMLDKFILKATKIKAKELSTINEKKIDWWMGAEDAIKYGVVDEIWY